MNLHQIKDAIALQVSAWETVSVTDYQSNQFLKEAIEDDFLSANDVTSQSHEFDADVDYDEVCELRAEAMHDVLIKHGVANADDLEDATDELEFSHFCGGCSSNNTHLVAYKVDNDNYRIFRYETDGNGRRLPGIQSHEISIADYDAIDGDDYNSLERFYKVDSLFFSL